MKRKCDIIVPVYNAPEYVEICVFAIFNNTKEEDLGMVYLLDDNSNKITHDLLDNLSKKYKNKLKVVHNKENLGFIKNVNQGFSMCTSDYVMLLNTDCFIAKNTVGKLMDHMNKNEKIGLICPICSNAANLTLEMYPGFSYMMMDELLEKKFKGINYDACTVVGNCLMISKRCIDEVGYLDEIYGMGYGDETDYQFKSMEKGFEAKVALDTYVFHKAEQSFNTTNKKRSERIEKNRKIFFDRWGDQYNELLKEYNKNDPIEYIKENITKEDKKPNLDFTFVLPQMGKGAGGVIFITQLVNYLSILGIKIGMLNLYPGIYDEIMNFEPLNPNLIGNFKSKFLIATIFDSIFFSKKLAEKMNSKVIYFSQGYEFMFLEGTEYGKVEASFMLADYVITISDYLKNNYKKLFNIEALKISNGIDYNILHIDNKKINKRPKIIMNLRNESLKGGFILNDIIKKLTIELNNVDINVINNSKKSDFCVNNNKTVNLNIIKGPIPRMDVYNLIKEADILVDSSLSEGFGLLPLEAMSVGTIPVISNALGNQEYCVNGKNSILINSVNNPDVYVEEIKKLIANPKKMEELQKEAIKTSEKYAFDDTIFEYYQVLNEIISNKVKPINRKLTNNDKKKLKAYLLTDLAYNRIMLSCKNNYVDCRKSTRKSNFIRIAKEYVKANIYLGKHLIKTITNKNHRL